MALSKAEKKFVAQAILDYPKWVSCSYWAIPDKFRIANNAACVIREVLDNKEKLCDT